MPNIRSFDEFSERLQIVLFTLGDLELNAVYDAYPGGKSWDEVPGQTGSGKKFHRNVISGVDFTAGCSRSGAGLYVPRRTLSQGNNVIRSPPRFVSSRRESDVTGYRRDHWRRVWEHGQMVAGVTLYPPSRQLDRRCRDSRPARSAWIPPQ